VTEFSAVWAYNPTTEWNYALAVDDPSEAHKIAVIETSIGDKPFSADEAPIRLQVKGRKLPEWYAEDGVANPVPQSPVISEQPEEVLTLLPYGAAKLRITAFPELKS
jgi:uncharacterized protein